MLSWGRPARLHVNIYKRDHFLLQRVITTLSDPKYAKSLIHSQVIDIAKIKIILNIKKLMYFPFFNKHNKTSV